MNTTAQNMSNNLKSAAREVTTEAKNLARETTAEVKSFAARAADTASDVYDDVSTAVTKGMRQASNKGADVAEWTANKMSDQVDQLRVHTMDKPIQTVAIAAGIGLLAGLILAR